MNDCMFCFACKQTAGERVCTRQPENLTKEGPGKGITLPDSAEKIHKEKRSAEQWKSKC